MPGDTRWRGPPVDALAIVPLDTLTLVYDRRSGQTHLLSEPLPQLLAALGAGPADAAALTARLSSQFDIADSDAAAIIIERLAELGAMGLIARG